MPRSTPGRYTHQYDGELVVFLIGMTVNRLRRPDLWMPVFRVMPAMLRELSTDPDSGMLGYRVALEGRSPTVIQYWSSLEKLYAYATGTQHRPAWATFNRLVRRAPGVVGVWHETYTVTSAESIYSETPLMGLAAATERVPVGARGDGARQRLVAGRTRSHA